MGEAIGKPNEDKKMEESMDNKDIRENRKRRLNEIATNDDDDDDDHRHDQDANKNNTNAKPNTSIAVAEILETEVQSKNVKARRRSDKKDAILEMIWICTECREAECATQDSPLLLCEGPCARPFHFPCAGLSSLPSSDEEWICTDCTEKRFQCVVCQEYGAEETDVHKCEKKDCSLFFHESCLNMYDVDVKVVEVSYQRDEHDAFGVDEHSDSLISVTVPKFVCPSHHCWVCADGMPQRCNEGSEAEKGEEEVTKKKKGKKRKAKKTSESLAASFKVKNERLLVSSLHMCLYICCHCYGLPLPFAFTTSTIFSVVLIAQMHTIYHVYLPMLYFMSLHYFVMNMQPHQSCLILMTKIRCNQASRAKQMR
jgi:hypothetical protein